MRKIDDCGVNCLEVGASVLLVAVLALEEFVGGPLLLEGEPALKYRMARFATEVVLVGLVCLAYVVMARRLRKRLREAERFLRVCSWCKKVWNDGDWIQFERYMALKHGELPTHGICDDCSAHMLEEAGASRLRRAPPAA